MREFREQRQVPRIRLLAPLAGRVLGTVGFRLLDLSLAGARIEHYEPLRLDSSWTVELPAALGTWVLSLRVIWTRVIGGKEPSSGGRSPRLESGLLFVHLTAAQQSALASILQRLTTQAKVTDKSPQQRKKRSNGR